MNNIRTLMTGTALAALLAAPVLAQSVDADANGTINGDVNVTAGATAGADMAAEGTQAPAAAGADAQQTLVAGLDAASPEVVGTPVLTADGDRVGEVLRVETRAEGDARVVVRIDGDENIQATAFAIPASEAVSADTVQDGQISLRWTKAELFASLNSQLGISEGSGLPAQTDEG